MLIMCARSGKNIDIDRGRESAKEVITLTRAIGTYVRRPIVRVIGGAAVWRPMPLLGAAI